MTGQRIRAVRQAYEMSLEEMARVLGVVQTTVYRWEHKGSAPRSKEQGRMLSLLERHCRDEAAQRQRIRATLSEATELGINVCTLFGADKPVVDSAKLRRLVKVIRELARL